MKRTEFCSVRPLATMICTLMLVAGCDGGGGIGLDIPVVTPLDGQWVTDTGEGLQFDGFSQEELHFADVLEVTATLSNAQDTCGGVVDDFGFLALEGTVQDGRLSLFAIGTQQQSVCLSGIFTDLRTLRVDTVNGRPERLFLNSRVDVDLEFGLWMNGGEDALRLKFNSPGSVDNDTIGASEVGGCVLTGAAGDIPFSGLMNGFDTGTGSNPVIPELRSTESGNELIFTDVVYVDDETMTLFDVSGSQYTLLRIPDPEFTSCRNN